MVNFWIKGLIQTLTHLFPMVTPFSLIQQVSLFELSVMWGTDRQNKNAIFCSSRLTEVIKAPGGGRNSNLWRIARRRSLTDVSLASLRTSSCKVCCYRWQDESDHPCTVYSNRTDFERSPKPTATPTNVVHNGFQTTIFHSVKRPMVAIYVGFGFRVFS